MAEGFELVFEGVTPSSHFFITSVLAAKLLLSKGYVFRDKITFAGIYAYSFALGSSLANGPSLVAISAMNSFVIAAQIIYDFLPPDIQSPYAEDYGNFFYGPMARGAILAGNGSVPLAPANLTTGLGQNQLIRTPGRPPVLAQ